MTWKLGSSHEDPSLTSFLVSQDFVPGQRVRPTVHGPTALVPDRESPPRSCHAPSGFPGGAGPAISSCSVGLAGLHRNKKEKKKKKKKGRGKKKVATQYRPLP